LKAGNLLRVLAFDTATEVCSVALLKGDELIWRTGESGRSHAQQVLEMVNDVLAEGEVPLAMLDGIAASVGPGSFTGVRISVAVAQGLAFGAQLRVAAVTTLEALALERVEAGAGRVLVCMDARMGEVYWGCFVADPARGIAAVSEARVGPPDSVRLPTGGDDRPTGGGDRPTGGDDRPTSGDYEGVGRGFSAYPMLAALSGVRIEPQSAQALPHAREIARLGALRLARGEGLDPADLQPLYLRDKVALTEAERASR
jgi:tRNA threonylcarbamoyladenosine biosynthesis protein TsaB